MGATLTVAAGIEVSAEALAELCRRYGIVELAVFGSVARGDHRADSDVDILVEFAPGIVRGLRYFDLERELADLFGRRVDLATKKWLKPAVRATVIGEARVLYAS